MSNEILLRFLEIGVIDVGGDDAKLEKLRGTVRDLTDTIKKSPSKALAYTLVAADPSVTPADPAVQEAMAALKKHWTTVANTFSGTPVALLRAMLLDALVQAARQDEAVAVAFVNSARNALPHVESGNEQPVWAEAVSEIETKVDARAEAEWATPETITLKPLAYEVPDAIEIRAKTVGFDRDAFGTKVQQAAVITQPHYFQQQPQTWASEFGSKLGVVLSDALEEVLAGSALEPIDVAPPLKALAQTVSVHVERALAAFGGATAGLQRRTNLLWWKEALYSPSAHASYRDLPAFEAAGLMALDLHGQVPVYSPASVSAFLDESIRLLPASAGASEPILTLVSEARISDAMAPLREIAALMVPPAAGRGPLLSLIGHIGAPGVLDGPSLRLLGGLGVETAVSPSAWGTWLFRELQAARAVVAPSAKRTQRRV